MRIQAKFQAQLAQAEQDYRNVVSQLEERKHLATRLEVANQAYNSLKLEYDAERGRFQSKIHGLRKAADIKGDAFAEIRRVTKETDMKMNELHNLELKLSAMARETQAESEKLAQYKVEVQDSIQRIVHETYEVDSEGRILKDEAGNYILRKGIAEKFFQSVQIIGENVAEGSEDLSGKIGELGQSLSETATTVAKSIPVVYEGAKKVIRDVYSGVASVGSSISGATSGFFSGIAIPLGIIAIIAIVLVKG